MIILLDTQHTPTAFGLQAHATASARCLTTHTVYVPEKEGRFYMQDDTLAAVGVMVYR
jgi:hypothetical protein